MTSQDKQEVVLYDLACIKGVCFSPVVWRIRLMLNYKQIPYKTVFLEFPDIEPTLKELGLAPAESGTKYTVPAIQHVASNTYLMGSGPVSEFLESKYPDPAVPLSSELGRQIETQARSVAGKTFGVSILPREINILSPRSQEYFRRTREASLGRRLEELLEGDKEEQSWNNVDDTMREVGELLMTNKADGPFVLGAQPSYSDFFIAGNLQCARVVDEGVFQRMIRYPGFGQVYKACLPFMEKKD